jgi:hypothetical protein
VTPLCLPAGLPRPATMQQAPYLVSPKLMPLSVPSQTGALRYRPNVNSSVFLTDAYPLASIRHRLFYLEVTSAFWSPAANQLPLDWLCRLCMW